MTCTPYEAAATLLAHVLGDLADTRAGVPARATVSPHPEPAVEFCSQVWVGYRGMKPADTRPGIPCGIWLLDLTIGVQRCYPVMPDNGPPPPAAIDSAARDIADDCEAVRRAIVDVYRGEDYRITAWRPAPPMGGSHGSRWDVTVAVQMGVYTEPLSPMLPGDPRA